MDERTVDLHGDGLIIFLIDHKMRIPMRFIVKRLGVLRRFARNPRSESH